MPDTSGRSSPTTDHTASIVNSFSGSNTWSTNTGNLTGRSSVYSWGNEDVSMQCCLKYAHLFKYWLSVWPACSIDYYLHHSVMAKYMYRMMGLWWYKGTCQLLIQFTHNWKQQVCHSCEAQGDSWLWALMCGSTAWAATIFVLWIFYLFHPSGSAKNAAFLSRVLKNVASSLFLEHLMEKGTSFFFLKKSLYKRVFPIIVPTCSVLLTNVAFVALGVW